MTKDFTQFEALSFDIVGTLIDFETGILKWCRPRVPMSITDKQILECFARVEKDLHMFLKFWPGMAKEFGIEAEPGAAEQFEASTFDWQPFLDSKQALAYLKQHYKLYTLTTGGRELADNLADKLGSPFTRVYTASDVGYSKPDARAFNTQLEALAKDGIKKEDVLWVAQSQFHDIIPAQKLGLTTMWIERRHDLKGYGATPVPDQGAATPDFHATSLQDFVAQVKKARGD